MGQKGNVFANKLSNGDNLLMVGVVAGVEVGVGVAVGVGVGVGDGESGSHFGDSLAEF